MSEEIKILVIDDTEQTRYILSRTLSKYGYKVFEGETGQQALDMAKNEHFDLIMLDIDLPDINGFEVCKLLKNEAPTLILQMSATFVENKHKAESLNGGADAFLTHPIDDIVLIATIKSMLRMRSAEGELRRLSEELQNKVALLNEQKELRERFVSALSHDLRVPLTSVRMSAELMQRKGRTADELMKFTSRIIHGVDRADQMIQDLLDANRIRAGENFPISPIHCDLESMATDLILDLQPNHPNKFILMAKGQLSGFWDCKALYRAIANLAVNAVKYGDTNKEVTIILEGRESDVLISVHNWGNQLSIEDQKSMFDPFWRSEKAKSGRKQGWGLGLAIVQGVAAAHGGVATVESDELNGTFFRISVSRTLQMNELGMV